MIVLTNGAVPLRWSVRPGGDGYRPYLGVVLADRTSTTPSPHPVVVWYMSSDDNQTWECESGDYCYTREEADEVYEHRRSGI